MHRLLLYANILIAGLLPAGEAVAQAPHDELTRLVQQLESAPNDSALRERIIHHVRQVKPAPAIPEEARRFFVRGNALMKDAKSPAEAGAAISEYRNALALAPWWGDLYFNFSLAQDLAGQHDDAIRSLRFYLMTSPQDAREAQDRIYALEAKQESTKRRRADAERQADIQRKQAQLETLYQTVRQWNAIRGCHDEGAAVRTVWEGCIGPLHRRLYHWIQKGTRPRCKLQDDRFVCETVAGAEQLRWPLEVIGTPRGPSVADIEWQCNFSGTLKNAPSYAQHDGSVIIDCWRPKGEWVDPGKRVPSIWLYHDRTN